MADFSLEMTLPSRGLLYDGAIPDGKIMYRPMTAREETLLAGGKGSILDSVLKACLDLPTGFTPANLLINDRFFALMIIRSVSYGETYKFNLVCDDCKTKFQHEVSLPGDFDIKVLEDDAREPFPVELPHSGKLVGFRLLRGEDETAIQKFTDRAFSKGKVEGDPSYTFRIARHLVEVDGEPFKDSLDSMRFFQNLIGKDSAALRNAIDEADFGLDIKLELECPRCEAFIETVMPMTSEFFRPRS